MQKFSIDYKVIFDAASNAMAFTNCNGIIMDVNAAWVQATGIPQAQATGKTAHTLGLWADESERKACRAALLRDGYVRDFEAVFVMLSGNRTHLLSGTRVEMAHEAYVLWELHDITERRLAERKIRLQAQAIEQSPMSIMITNEQVKIEFVNESNLLYSGYSREEVLGQNPKLLSSGNTPRATYEALWNTLGQNKVWVGEFINRRKNGEIYHERATISAIRQADGAISNYVAVKQDITEQKKVEQQLNQVLTEQRAILESDLVGFVKIKNRTIVWANSAFENLLGYQPGELIGQSSRILYPSEADFLSLGDNAYPHLAAGKIYRSRIEFVRKQGSAIWLDINGAALDSQQNESLWGFIDVTERRLAELSLNLQRDRTQSYLDTMQIMMVALDQFGNITMINRAGCELLGYQEQELLGRNWFSTCLPQPEGLEQVFPVFQKILSGELAAVQRYENPVLCRDGRLRMISWYNAYIDDASGQHTGVLTSGQDITDEKQSYIALQDSNQKMKLLLQSMGEGAFGVDHSGCCTFVNDAFLAILGYECEAEVLGQHIHELIHYAHADGTPYPASECRMYAAYRNNEKVHCADEVFWHKFGVPIAVEYWASPIVINGVMTGAVATFMDITERKLAEERMKHLATCDPLTDLPNRALLEDRLRQAIIAAKREHAHVGLMFIDLDKFKPINDSYGHDVGDQVLVEAARRMQACIRASDTVARVGGDEFIVLLPEVESEADARLVAEKIRYEINQAMKLAGLELQISSSIGIALFPEHGDTELTLLKAADTAMYQAKQAGRDNVQLFGQECPG